MYFHKKFLRILPQYTNKLLSLLQAWLFLDMTRSNWPVSKCLLVAHLKSPFLFILSLPFDATRKILSEVLPHSSLLYILRHLLYLFSLLIVSQLNISHFLSELELSIFMILLNLAVTLHPHSFWFFFASSSKAWTDHWHLHVTARGLAYVVLTFQWV